jgi:hypothetical protein
MSISGWAPSGGWGVGAGVAAGVDAQAARASTKARPTAVKIAPSRTVYAPLGLFMGYAPTLAARRKGGALRAAFP